MPTPDSIALHTDLKPRHALLHSQKPRRASPKYWDAKGPIEAWHAEALKANWASPQELKAQFRTASVLKNSRVVFNIGGNKYRLMVAIDYRRQAMFVKFIGTHQEYDCIDAENV